MVSVGSEGIGHLIKGLREFQGRYTWLDTYRVPLAILSVLLIVAPLALRWWIEVLDRRHRDIRLILGRHLLGSSDPVYWTRQTLSAVRPPQSVFGVGAYPEAVTSALATGDFSQAMFAARLAAAKTDRQAGESLTDNVLRHPQVQAALKHLRANPSRRDEFVSPTPWQPSRVFE